MLRAHRSIRLPCYLRDAELNGPISQSKRPHYGDRDIPLPWTMLAGCGNVCMRSTAHKSTGEFGSCPSDGSRHKTNRSLQRIPIKDRGVSSGDRHSTCTSEVSPCESMTSNDTVALRTTRVRCNEPSIMRRLRIDERTETPAVMQN